MCVCGKKEGKSGREIKERREDRGERDGSGEAKWKEDKETVWDTADDQRARGGEHSMRLCFY